MAERTLNHFSVFSFRPEFWELDGVSRAQLLSAWSERLADTLPVAHFYQVYPAHDHMDLLLWTAVEVGDPGVPERFFADYARLITPMRPYLHTELTLWGLTKPSMYARGRSTQELNPFSEERQPYLVVYPFVKTADWYLMSRDARQGMMNEHIRKGREYPQITQLLLYSFGLQDQEFVVVYETADLGLFSDLVQDLRSSEARRFTERDTPIITGVFRTTRALIDIFASSPAHEGRE